MVKQDSMPRCCSHNLYALWSTSLHAFSMLHTGGVGFAESGQCCSRPLVHQPNCANLCYYRKYLLVPAGIPDSDAADPSFASASTLKHAQADIGSMTSAAASRSGLHHKTTSILGATGSCESATTQKLSLSLCTGFETRSCRGS